jgi:hypothetical protein
MTGPSQAPFVLPLPLDRVTALALDDGAHIEVHGRVATTVDGRTFDAADLFDFAAGGLRVVDHDGARFAYSLEATGRTADGCAAAGAPAPCLVPRLAALAHERLRTVKELTGTLSGGIELEALPAESALPAIVGKLAAGGLGFACAVVVAWVAFALPRRLARTALGRVRIAARQALRATKGDETLARVRKQIRILVVRAHEIDSARRACAKKVRRIDRTALARRLQACSRSSVPEAAAAVASLTAEQAEAVRLEGDHASSVMDLERIESALRVVVLRAGERRGLATTSDPVDALVAELDLRDQAIAEADLP